MGKVLCIAGTPISDDLRRVILTRLTPTEMKQFRQMIADSPVLVELLEDRTDFKSADDMLDWIRVTLRTAIAHNPHLGN